MSLYVGLDVGTQSVKLLAYDPALGEVVATAARPMQLVSQDDGTREQDARWWIDGIVACFAELSPSLRSRIRAIGVSGQQHGFVPINARGEVIAPVKLWCDTSTAADCEPIMAAVGGAAACIALAGNPILAGYTASKLPWTRRHRAQAYAELDGILLPHDYINFWLTGQRYAEYGDASGTGWLDVRHRRWSPELLQAIDPQRDLLALLPPLVPLETTFTLAPTIAALLDLPADVQVSTGGGDNMMAALGTGNVAAGRLTMSLGTSGTLFAYADHPVVDDDGRWAAFCSSSGGWLPLICTMNCTVATERMAALFNIPRGGGEVLMAQTDPGAGGLVMLPYFNGERTPDLPNARACLHGMDLHNTTPAHFYRAAMEGATYSLRNGYDAFTGAGLSFDTVLLTGGGSNSAAWRQLIADVFDLPVKVPTQAEGAAFGAALQGLWAAQRGQGGSDSLAATVDAHVRFDDALSATPDPRTVPRYAEQYRRFLHHLSEVGPLLRTDPSPPQGSEQ